MNWWKEFLEWLLGMGLIIGFVAGIPLLIGKFFGENAGTTAFVITFVIFVLLLAGGIDQLHG